jgi:hypothetical protein
VPKSTIALCSLLLASAAACSGGDGKTAAKDNSLALSSPKLCEHLKTLEHPALGGDDDRCVMRLDGLQIQLGQDDWKPHGKCIADATTAVAVDDCLKKADEASLARASAKK